MRRLLVLAPASKPGGCRVRMSSMPIRLGQRAEHSFAEPLGLLSDCHRRIEHFLGLLIRVVEENPDGPLTPPQREALDVSLRYFREAAPRHTQDEEASLFPRLRASDQPEVREALEKLDRLEADHDRADAAHARVDAMGTAWLAQGTLSIPAREELSRLLIELRELYQRHIAVEDRELFPLAGRVLDQTQLASVGREMADRRGVRS